MASFRDDAKFVDTLIGFSYPPAGIEPYIYPLLETEFIPANTTSFSVSPSGEVTGAKKIKAIRTPLFVSNLSASANNFKFSEALVNRLSVLDLNLKFGTPLLKGIKFTRFMSAFIDAANATLAPGQGTGFTPAFISNKALYANNVDGFPQMYSGSSLFCGLSPFSAQNLLDNFQKFKSLYGIKTFFQDQLVDSDKTKRFRNVLEFDSGGTEFSNDYFVLPMSTPGFLLPVGHLIYRETGGRVVVIRTGDSSSGQPGLYTIERKSNNFLVTGKGESKLVDETPAHNEAKTASLATLDGRLLFMSPYTDMTVERMSELPYDKGLVAYRTHDANTSVFAASTDDSKSPDNFMSPENAGHTEGVAVDFCPAYVTAASGTPLQVKELLYTALAERLSYFLDGDSSGEKDPSGVKRIEDALSISTKDSNGVTFSPLKVPIFHAQLNPTSVAAYQKRLLPLSHFTRRVL